MYDPAKPWITHVSIQGDDFAKIPEWRAAFRKPLIFDECKYEGNIPKRWGDISAREMTRRFWLGMAYGAYVGHGETYLDAHDVLWWSKGGVLHGESSGADRIPARDRRSRTGVKGYGPADRRVLSLRRARGRILSVLPGLPPTRAGRFRFAGGVTFTAEIIDPWAMTITKADGDFSGKFQLKMPGKEMLAVRFPQDMSAFY